MVAVNTTVRTRTAEPGAPVTLLMLASGPRGGIGVDLDSGAMVRARYEQPVGRVVRPFDVVTTTVADTQDEPDPTRPEALVVNAPLRPAGLMRGRTIRRMLRRLVQPAGKHLLGVPGPALPFWTMTAAGPSVVLVEPEHGPDIAALAGTRPGGSNPRCQFRWGGQDLDLPLQDRHLQSVMARTGQTRVSGPGLAHAIGGPPAHLLVTLTPPFGGHCYKVVAGVLPRP
ncbi:MAG TPA: hypothetical protein VF954_00875 [Acidimicrobiales bacterium]